MPGSQHDSYARRAKKSAQGEGEVREQRDSETHA